jgi:hypothetical protein
VIRIKVPHDPITEEIITKSAERVMAARTVQEADDIEAEIKKEAINLALAHNNQNESLRYSFLLLPDLAPKDRLYYNWRLYSFRNGGTATRWAETPFQFLPSSAQMYVPPECNE